MRDVSACSGFMKMSFADLANVAWGGGVWGFLLSPTSFSSHLFLWASAFNHLSGGQFACTHGGLANL
jgi:hypothetical protein